MEEKNELNDLLLGEENKGGGGKKLFLIIAGALLVFFVTIGIMKFVNSGDDKANANATKVVKEAPKPEANKTADAGTAPNDEKLNEIVRKLQEDAKTQQAGAPSTPLDAPTDKNATTPKTAAVNVPIKKVEPAPTPTPAPIVASKPEPTPAPAAKPAPKSQVPVTTEAPKEAKEVLKEAVKPAPAPIAKPAPAPKPAPKPQAQAKKEAAPAPVAAKAEPAQSGGYYIQVGYADSDKSAEPIKSKASGAGYKVTTKQAQVKDKNVTKIFVGPFNSKEEAEKEKQKVREQIKNDAFVIKG